MELKKDFWLHKLVITAFRGPRPKGMQCRHLDGNALNNRLDNLVWGTPEEDFADRIKHGKIIKLTPERVRYIRSSTKTNRTLAKELGCSQPAISCARSGRSWATTAPEKICKLRKPRRLTPDLVRQIRSSDKTNQTLATKFGCHKETIRQVRAKISWTHVV